MRYDAVGMRVKRKPYLLISWLMLLVGSIALGVTAIVLLVGPIARLSTQLPSGNCVAVAVVSAKPGDGLAMVLPAGTPIVCRDANSTVSGDLPGNYAFTARASGPGAGLVPGNQASAQFPFTPRYADTGEGSQLSAEVTVREPVVLVDVPVQDVEAAASLSWWAVLGLIVAVLMGVASFVLFLVWLITGLTRWWRTARP